MSITYCCYYSQPQFDKPFSTQKIPNSNKNTKILWALYLFYNFYTFTLKKKKRSLRYCYFSFQIENDDACTHVIPSISFKNSINAPQHVERSTLNTEYCLSVFSLRRLTDGTIRSRFWWGVTSSPSCPPTRKQRRFQVSARGGHDDYIAVMPMWCNATNPMTCPVEGVVGSFIL